MRKKGILDALMPRTRQGILAATLGQPEKAWYISELARRMAVSPSSLQLELDALSLAEILTSHRQGRMVYYQANSNSPVFRDLQSLLLKTRGLVDVLAEALRPLAKSILVSFVYGSVASGDARSNSDVDLMVVGDISPLDLALPLRSPRQILERDINPTVYTKEEFQKKRDGKDHFLSDVLDKPKLFVIGNEDDLGRTRRK